MLQLRFFFQWILDYSSLRQGSLFLFGPSEVGLLLFTFRIFDAISDPLAGFLSDALRIRGYKRNILMKFAIPLISFGLVLSFSSTFETSTYINWILICVGFFLFFSGYTLYCIPYWALVEDLSGKDVKKKYELSSALGIGVFAATAIGFVLTPFLIQKFDYFAASIMVAIISTPLLCLPILLEGSNLSQVEEKSYTNLSEIFYKLTLPIKNPDFIKIMLQLVSVQMAFTALTAISPAFVNLVLKKDKEFLALIMGPVIGSALLTFIFLGSLVDKFGWSRVLFVASMSQGLLFIFAYLIFISDLNIVTSYLILFAMFGFPMAAVLGIEAYAITQVMKDANQVGLYYGCFNFLVKGFNGLTILVTGVIIDLATKGGLISAIPQFLGITGALIILCTLVSTYRLKRL